MISLCAVIYTRVIFKGLRKRTEGNVSIFFVLTSHSGKEFLCCLAAIVNLEDKKGKGFFSFVLLFSTLYRCFSSDTLRTSDSIILFHM